MDLSERVERWEKDRVYSDDPLMLFLRDLIEDWKKVRVALKDVHEDACEEWCGVRIGGSGEFHRNGCKARATLLGEKP